MFRDSKAFFSYSVEDLKRAKEFYANLLGLDVRETPEGLSLQLSGGGSAFLYPKPNHEPATFTVLNFRVDDVEKAVDALVAKGVRFEQYDLPGLKTDAKGTPAATAPPSPGSKTPTATSSRSSNHNQPNGAADALVRLGPRASPRLGADEGVRRSRESRPRVRLLVDRDQLPVVEVCVLLRR